MKKAVKILFIILISFFVTLSLAILIICASLSIYKDSKVDIRLIELTLISEKTGFYAYSKEDRELRRGEPYEIVNAELDNGERYEFTPLSSIPDNLKNAFIAIEDKRFYSHKGIDPKRSLLAAFNYIFGKGDFGGSTITQQLIKNVTGNTEISVRRKLEEAFSALDLERKYDKSQILEAYLNIINLAEGCRGVGAASEYYYSKIPKELTLDQCATIAAITNNPSKYDPLKHPENNKKRRDLILLAMLEQGYITNEECKNAIDTPISLNVNEETRTAKVNSWYIDTVIEDVIRDLSSKLGISRQNASRLVYRGGLNIYTAMDEKVQSILEEYYSNEYNFPIDESGSVPQSSMIIIDQSNGDIIAVAGAVGEKKGNRIQNFATSTKRPTGSAIKPLSVYAPAVDMGLINWGTIIEDSPLYLKENGEPWPQNANRVYFGNVNVNFAIANSLNTVAVKVLEMVGNKSSFDFLTKKLRIYNLDEKSDLGSAALALGQMSRGITLRELTAAYSIFDSGNMSKPRSYFKVTDCNGNILLDNRTEQERVISTESAAVMTKMLQSVIEIGTAKEGITLKERTEVAGKSGTTQNNCDRYFIGYTPELLGGVWFGYEYPESLEKFGGNLSVYIWDDVMTEIFEKTDYCKKTTFAIPDTVQRFSVNKTTGKLPNPDDDPLEIEDGWFSVSGQ